MAKIGKSTAFYYLTREAEDAHLPPVDKTLIIIDGNATFHAVYQIPPNVCQRLYAIVPSSAN